jgi:hypothetical protein
MVWNWQTILVLIITGILLIGFVWTLVVYFRMKKIKLELLREIAEWKTKFQNLESEIDRVESEIKNKVLTDESAIKKLRDSLANWSARKPNDGTRSGGTD